MSTISQFNNAVEEKRYQSEFSRSNGEVEKLDELVYTIYEKLYSYVFALYLHTRIYTDRKYDRFSTTILIIES